MNTILHNYNFVNYSQPPFYRHLIQRQNSIFKNAVLVLQEIQ